MPAGVIVADPPLVPIESAPVERIASFSTSDLAPILNATQKRFRLVWMGAAAALLAMIVAAQGNAALLPGALIFALVATLAAALLDRYRRSVRIEFKFEGLAGNIATALLGSFEDLKKSRSVWSVASEGYTSDWKRSAGATTLNTRNEFRPTLGKPYCIRSKSTFPSLKVGKTDLYFFPDGVLVVTSTSVTALAYGDIKASYRPVRFVEAGPIPSDTTVVDQTWRYVNKNGGPDLRFNSNKQLPVCLYGEMDIQSDGGLNVKIQFSNPTAGERLVKLFDLLDKLSSSGKVASPAISFRAPRALPTAIYSGCLVLGTSLLVILGTLSRPSLRVEAPESKMSDQTSSVPLPPTRPMGGPLVESPNPKSIKSLRPDLPSTSIGAPLSINPLDSQSLGSQAPLPRNRPK